MRFGTITLYLNNNLIIKVAKPLNNDLKMQLL